MSTRQHDAASVAEVALAEWESKGPETTLPLRDLDLGAGDAVARVCDPLRARLDIRQERSGVRVAATSFVGRVQVGPLRITIRPKLESSPLSRLLRYAYGIDDLTLQNALPTSILHGGLHDLLIEMLVHEVDHLLRIGLSRSYLRMEAELAMPRGRIAVGTIASRGGVREPRLPCVFHDRSLDWTLNRVIRAGLARAVDLVVHRPLARHVARLEASFATSVGITRRLDLAEVERAEFGLTRLTAGYAPALTLIRLLCGADGVSLEPTAHAVPLSGFLFDMNRFFQRLLSRFLRENLTGGRVEDERTIRDMLAYDPAANPRRQPNPRLRPDFAIFEGTKLAMFADAKYRDIWACGTPIEWLYQLQAYAWAAPKSGSVMLYASAEPSAKEERLFVRIPLGETGPASSIVLRPVPLARLADVVAGAGHLFRAKRKRLASELIWGSNARAIG